MRYLEGEHFRILVAVEMGMKNHEVVPLALVAAIAKIHRGAVNKLCGDLCKHSLIALERGHKREWSLLKKEEKRGFQMTDID